MNSLCKNKETCDNILPRKKERAIEENYEIGGKDTQPHYSVCTPCGGRGGIV